MTGKKPATLWELLNDAIDGYTKWAIIEVTDGRKMAAIVPPGKRAHEVARRLCDSLQLMGSGYSFHFRTEFRKNEAI